MDENLHNIDDLFKKALNEHEDTPSSRVWEIIDKNLDKRNILSISRKYRKLKWVAAAMVIFSAGMAMYTWNTKMRNKELVRSNNTSRKKLSEKVTLEKKITPNIVTNPDLVNKRANQPKQLSTSTKSAANDSALSAVNGQVTKQKNVTDTTSIAAENKKVNHKPDVAKLSSQRIELARKAGLIKEESPKEFKKKTSADKSEEFEKTVFNKSTGKENNNITGKEKNTNATFDNSLTSLEKRVVTDVATVREKTERFDIGSIPKSLSDRLATDAGKQQILKEETPAARSKKLKTKSVNTSPWSATAFYSPDFVWSHINNDRHDFREDDRDAIKSKESIKNASTFGVAVNFNAGKKLTIQSGISFSTLTTNIQPKTIYARPDDRGNINYRFNCSAGYSYVTLKSVNAPASGDSIMALTSTNNLQYVSVPLGIGYRLTKGNFSLIPQVGITVNFLTRGKIETVIAAAAGNEKADINHIDGLNSSYFNGTISLRADYYFTRNLAFNFTPVTRFALTAINDDAPVKTYLNSLGLAVGLTMRF